MNDYITEADLEAAEDEMLRQVDTLQDWLGGECIRASEQPHRASLVDIDAARMTTPALLAFAFDREQRDSERCLAINEMAKRYLAHHSVVVNTLAERIAIERIDHDIGDEQDYWEAQADWRRVERKEAA